MNFQFFTALAHTADHRTMQKLEVPAHTVKTLTTQPFLTACGGLVPGPPHNQTLGCSSAFYTDAQFAFCICRFPAAVQITTAFDLQLVESTDTKPRDREN